MLRMGANRALRRGREPCRLCQPHPHAARPGHHGRLRATPVGQRDGQGQLAPRRRISANRCGGRGFVIWPALRRLIAVAFGFILAILAGAITLFVLGARWAAGEVASFTPQEADDVSRAINQGLGLLAFFFTVAPVLTLLPGLAAAVVGEVARIRSLLYYLIAGGAAATLMP